jgi:UDP-N-acetylmuramoyl-L-alanyl-D-glutamate--2,6-diaminopimelate ligase
MSAAQRAATVGELAAALPGALLIGSGGALVQDIAYDSRLVRSGSLFAALRGSDFDGHDFVDAAEANGAVALLVEEPVPKGLPQIVAAESRAALACLAAAHFGHPSDQVGVIGITGTDGKTTTSFIVDHILRSVGVKTGLIGTIAIRIGDDEDVHASRQTTPESSDIQRCLRQMADADVGWAILEATSHGLAMHRLDHVRFRIGAVTNITHEHLDFHGTVERYRRAKAILVERVAEQAGIVVLNADDPGACAIAPYASGATILRYSASGAAADMRAEKVQAGASGSRFVLEADGRSAREVQLPLVGEFNVANALCAVAVALAAGCELDGIVGEIERMPPVPGRMARIESGQPFSVVIDYAHTPDSLAKVLRLLRQLHPQGRLIAVFGSAGERDVEKRPMQGEVSARLADITIVTSEDPRFEDADAIIGQIADGAVQTGAKPERTLFTRTDRREAIRLAIELAEPNDCILLAGKGHEGSIIWGREKAPWNEAQVARELLAEAGYGDAG